MKRLILIFPLLLQLSEAQPPATVSCAGADFSSLKSFIYVSPEGIHSDSCGQSPTTACKTIQRGVNNCKGDGCGVLVRYGVYSSAAPVQLADGVSLYGSCTFDGIERKYRSTVLGRPAISANNISRPTLVYGFVMIGADASAGEASIAMAASNSKGLMARTSMAGLAVTASDQSA